MNCLLSRFQSFWCPKPSNVRRRIRTIYPPSTQEQLFIRHVEGDWRPSVCQSDGCYKMTGAVELNQEKEKKKKAFHAQIHLHLPICHFCLLSTHASIMLASTMYPV